MTKKETAEDYQKYLSEGIVNDATMTASLGIGKLYSKNTFTHPSENEDEEITVKGLDDRAIIEAIRKQEKLLEVGDVTSLENMLLSQTHVLNAVFTNMVSHLSAADTLTKLDTYGRLALKAQTQTRQTISTLAEIKGIKKTTFIHQVNQAHNQQVNNGAGENLKKSANERELINLDTRSKKSSTGEDSNDETLALPENAGGAGTFSPKRTQARDAVGKVARVRKAVS
ncbi:MAG: hypothetical protein QNL62_03620 [Gammaproteobacteria bacterium]|nr:hypothetical protein [Gammaproteobacteria bacterium]